MSKHAITRVRHEPRRRLLTVRQVKRITPGMARVTLGGDLAGFILLRGTRERLDEVQRSAEFELLLARSGMIVDRIGVVHAYTGEALGRLVGQFQQATAEFGT